MKRIHSAIASVAANLGWPGILGLGLLVFVCGLYFSMLRPEQSRLDDLRQQVAKARAQRAGLVDDKGIPTAPADRLSAFYGFFPRPTALPDLLGKIYAVAKGQGLQLELGEYRASSDKSGGLTQFQLTLPVRGAYPQIRKFVDGAMAEVPTLSLDGIQFDRQKVGESTVDAKVKLTVYLGKTS